MRTLKSNLCWGLWQPSHNAMHSLTQCLIWAHVDLKAPKVVCQIWIPLHLVMRQTLLFPHSGMEKGRMGQKRKCEGFQHLDWRHKSSCLHFSLLHTSALFPSLFSIQGAGRGAVEVSGWSKVGPLPSAAWGNCLVDRLAMTSPAMFLPSSAAIVYADCAFQPMAIPNPPPPANRITSCILWRWSCQRICSFSLWLAVALQGLSISSPAIRETFSFWKSQRLTLTLATCKTCAPLPS